MRARWLRLLGWSLATALVLLIAFRMQWVVPSGARAHLFAELRAAVPSQYVDPAATECLERALAARAAPAFPLSTSIGLVRDVNAAFRQCTDDPHLVMKFTLLPQSREEVENSPTAEQLRRQWAREHADNFGIRRAELMDSNIGYLRLDRFAVPEAAEVALAQVMDSFRGARALIIDLRENRGGTAEMGVLLASYFFEKPTPWVEFHSRQGAEALETHAEVRGQKFLDKPVIILISRRTFSAGEGFAYHMKNLGRATLIGERTRGGANAGYRHPVSSHYVVFIPTLRAMSPITRANWERSGVSPHHEVSAEEALTAALHALASTGER